MDIPTVLPILSVLSAGVGAWAGVKIAVAKLETRVEFIERTVNADNALLHRHSEDLLVHDAEIESALSKLDLPRIRRQRLRDI